MEFSTESRLFEKAIAAKTAETFARALTKLEKTLTTQSDAKLAERRFASLNYVIRRSIRASAIDCVRIQKNALTIFVYFLRSHKALNWKAIADFIAQTTEIENAANKSERKYFEFANIALNFVVLNQGDVAVREKCAAKILKATENGGFALFALSAMISAFECNANTLIEMSKAISDRRNIYSIDFCFALAKSLGDALPNAKPSDRSALSQRLSEVSRGARNALNSDIFFAAFASAESDAHFSGRTEMLKTPRKAAEFVLQNAAARVAIVSRLINDFCENWIGGKRPKRAATNLFLEFTRETLGAICSNESARDAFLRLLALVEREFKGRALALRNGFLVLAAKESDADFALKSLFFASKAVNSKVWLPIISKCKAETADSTLEILEEKIENANSLAETLNLIDRFLVFVSAKKTNSNKIAEIYKKARKYVRRFESDQKEKSENSLICQFRSELHNRVIHSIFPILSLCELIDFVRNWREKGDSTAIAALKTAIELGKNGQNEIARCLLVCLLQNRDENANDRNTSLFQNAINGLLSFCEELNRKRPSSNDMQSLTETLIALLGVDSATLRLCINAVFKQFADLIDEDCLEIIESAFFEGNAATALPTQDEDDEEVC